MCFFTSSSLSSQKALATFSLTFFTTRLVLPVDCCLVTLLSTLNVYIDIDT